MSYMVVLTFNGVNTFSRHYSDQVSDQLPDFQDQKSVMLFSSSFSKSDSEHVASCFVYEGSVSVIYECL